MGKSVISIEAYNAEETVVAAARKAVSVLRAEGVSLSAATSTYHPGEPDEHVTDLLAVPEPPAATGEQAP